MSLREEIETMIDHESLAIPLALEVAIGGDRDVSPGEVLGLIGVMLGVHRRAILRLAEKLDELDCA